MTMQSVVGTQRQHRALARLLKRANKHLEYRANGLNGPRAVARRQRQMARTK